MSKSKLCFEILWKKAFRWHLETWGNQIGSIFKLNIKRKSQTANFFCTKDQDRSYCLLYILCKEPCVASVEPVSPSLQQRYCLQVHLKGFALDIQGLPFSSGVIGFSRYREKQQHFPAYSFSSILGLVVRLVSPSLQQRGSLFLKSSWLDI